MQISNEEKQLLLSKFLDAGRVPFYDHTVPSIQLSDTDARRFIFDSWYVKKVKKTPELANAKKFNRGYTGLSFFETLSFLMEDNYALYAKLFDHFEKVDKFASTITPSCAAAMILFCHNSFGDRLFPHLHPDHERRTPTMTLFFNLTKQSADIPVLTLLDPVDENSRMFTEGYTNHKLMYLHEKKSVTHKEIPITDGTGVFFNSFNVPHHFSYTDDLWVAVVYDHIEATPEILNKGQHTFNFRVE